MKISAFEDSPDHWAFQFPTSPEIYLDDEIIDHVIEADDETGTVIVMQMNGAYPIFAGGRFITKTLTGKVEIRPAA